MCFGPEYCSQHPKVKHRWFPSVVFAHILFLPTTAHYVPLHRWEQYLSSSWQGVTLFIDTPCRLPFRTGTAAHQGDSSQSTLLSAALPGFQRSSALVSGVRDRIPGSRLTAHCPVSSPQPSTRVYGMRCARWYQYLSVSRSRDPLGSHTRIRLRSLQYLLRLSLRRGWRQQALPHTLPGCRQHYPFVGRVLQTLPYSFATSSLCSGFVVCVLSSQTY